MPEPETSSSPACGSGSGRGLATFRSELVERVRASGGVWRLSGGEIRLPREFGFCRGVERALEMLLEAVQAHAGRPGRLFLLGPIIHNPWVNEFFERRGVRMLREDQLRELEALLRPGDCAVIPAFGVRVEIERRLAAAGCRVVDTTCGNVRRLWTWADRAARDGRGVVIFGRPAHDETVVTRSRLADLGGRYVVLSGLDEARAFCDLHAADAPPEAFRAAFDERTTNAESLAPFERLAQVSQTTMLYDETMRVREMLRAACERRFGTRAAEHMLFEPTVCRATQERQSAAVELCRGGCDVVLVVGGFGSSNTRHLFELARGYGSAHFIEDAGAIRSADELVVYDSAADAPTVARGWLPARRPLRVGVLAGASSPEIVLGQVLERLAELLR